MSKPIDYRKLPFYVKKLNALLSTQPFVYATELFPANWLAIEKRAMIQELKETEEYYVLEMKEVRFFSDFQEYLDAKDKVELTVALGDKLDCVTLQRPAGSKISIWPAELQMVLKELHAYQAALATRHLEKD